MKQDLKQPVPLDDEIEEDEDDTAQIPQTQQNTKVINNQPKQQYESI